MGGTQPMGGGRPPGPAASAGDAAGGGVAPRRRRDIGGIVSPAAGRNLCDGQDGGMSIATLVQVRHGESVWNAELLCSGCVDVDLSERGEAEARRGGQLLREHKLLPDVVHT